MNTVCLSIDLGLLCFLSAMFYCFHHKDLEHVLLNVHLSFYESVSIARGEENGWMLYEKIIGNKKRISDDEVKEYYFVH